MLYTKFRCGPCSASLSCAIPLDQAFLDVFEVGHFSKIPHISVKGSVDIKESVFQLFLSHIPRQEINITKGVILPGRR